MQSDTFASEPPAQPLALDADAVNITHKLARWMKITGSIQLAFAAMVLALLGLGAACSMLALGPLAMLAMAIPLVIAATFLFQGLRMQAAGEQFDNLANELHPDYLELAFGRLRTVFVIEMVVACLYLLGSLLELAGVK